MAYVAGLDLGATTIRAAVADGEGAVAGASERPTPRGPSGAAVTEAALEALRAACRDAGIAPGRIEAAGVGSIGPLDRDAGAAVDPANLPAAVDRIPLVGPVSELVGSGRVHLHNDADAGVIGERFYGEAPDDLVYLTISSGIGAGVAVDGAVLSGRDGNAGEVGHLVVDPRGLLTCGCGGAGHWEAYCSGENIPRFARLLYENDRAWRAPGGDDPDDVPGGAGVDTALPLDDLSAKAVFERAGEDAFAAGVVDQLARWNAIGFADVVHAYAPEAIRVGGAVALNNEALVLDPVRERLEGLVMTRAPDVERARFGADAVVRGALASALTGGTGDRGRTRR